MAADVLAEDEDLLGLLVPDDAAVHAVRLLVRGRELCEKLVGAGEDIAGLEAHIARTFENLLRLAVQDLTGAEIARVCRIAGGPRLCLRRRHDRGLQRLLVDIHADDVVVRANLAHLRQDADDEVRVVTR